MYRQLPIQLPTRYRFYPILECTYHMMRIGINRCKPYQLGMEYGVIRIPHRGRCSTFQRCNQDTSHVCTWLRDIKGFSVLQSHTQVELLPQEYPLGAFAWFSQSKFIHRSVLERVPSFDLPTHNTFAKNGPPRVYPSRLIRIGVITFVKMVSRRSSKLIYNSIIPHKKGTIQVYRSRLLYLSPFHIQGSI